MSDFSYSDLRRYWQESAEREAKNPPPDKPTHAFMAEHGRPMGEYPMGETVWVIADGSEGVFLGNAHARKDGRFLFFVQEAGDLWPASPTKWHPRA